MNDAPTINREAVAAALAGGFFCTLATSSAANRPHVAGVLYALVGREMYVNTDRDSRKARNVAENDRVAVCVPVLAPLGMPPFTATFQGTATLLANDDPEVTGLVESGELAAITSHGELERPGTCMVKITPGRRMVTYGIGVPDEVLATDPLSAFGSVEW
jgi:general stress protein 26